MKRFPAPGLDAIFSWAESIFSHPVKELIKRFESAHLLNKELDGKTVLRRILRKFVVRVGGTAPGFCPMAGLEPAVF
jgi:hypothetical protein